MFVFVQRALYFCKDVTRHNFADVVFLMYHSKIVEILSREYVTTWLDFLYFKKLEIFVFLYFSVSIWIPSIPYRHLNENTKFYTLEYIKIKVCYLRNPIAATIYPSIMDLSKEFSHHLRFAWWKKTCSELGLL